MGGEDLSQAAKMGFVKHLLMNSRLFLSVQLPALKCIHLGDECAQSITIMAVHLYQSHLLVHAALLKSWDVVSLATSSLLIQI